MIIDISLILVAMMGIDKLNLSKVAEKHFDVIIIGAGPAGLFAAYELEGNLNSRLQILVVDKGADYEMRKCPIVDKGLCKGCGRCHMACGLGGAGLFLSAKLSFYPAGSGLDQLSGGKEETLNLNSYVSSIFKELGGFEERTLPPKNRIDEMTKKAQEFGIKFKYYPVEMLNSERTRVVINNLKRRYTNTSFAFMTKALSIDRLGEQRWAVILEDEKGTYRATSDFLVLALGKAGTRWLHQQADKLELKREHNPIEIGIRIEMPRKTLESATTVHKDLKLLLEMDSGQVRTFCVCEAGLVVMCKYNNELLLGGKCAGTGNSNFALVLRKKLPESIDPIEYGFSISRSIRKMTKNRVLVQTLDDFRRRKPSTFSKISNNKVKCTIAIGNLAPGDITKVYSSDTVSSLETALLTIDNFLPGVNDDKNLVYAPEIELCWDKFILDSGMQTNLDRLYIVGDACGHVRGIVQSAITGVLAARGILDSMHQ